MYSATFVYADFRRSGDSASVYFRSRIRVNVKLFFICEDFIVRKFARPLSHENEVLIIIVSCVNYRIRNGYMGN